MKKTILLTSLVISFFVIYAQYGELDPSFGIDGKVTLNTSSGFDNAAEIIAREDGKIIVIGTGTTDGINQFLVARYLSDGTLDTEFGVDGITLTQIGNSNSYGVSGVIQDDGKIVVAGSSDEGGQNVFAVARYNPDGSLDETFADNGIFTSTLVDGPNTLTDIALQADGKMVACGYAGSGLQEDFGLLRLNGYGSIDDTFGDNGKVVYDISGGMKLKQYMSYLMEKFWYRVIHPMRSGF